MARRMVAIMLLALIAMVTILPVPAYAVWPETLSTPSCIRFAKCSNSIDCAWYAAHCLFDNIFEYHDVVGDW